MATLKNKAIKHSMQTLLNITAFLARHESLMRVNNKLLQGLARHRAKHVKQSAKSLQDLGQVWQQAFPSSKQVPITNITEDTVYAEIHTSCPHRGSGDLQACYRMMEYDRAFVKKFGGEFVVLESQAEPGVRACKVAMQFADAKNLTPLEPAHLRDFREPSA